MEEKVSTEELDAVFGDEESEEGQAAAAEMKSLKTHILISLCLLLTNTNAQGTYDLVYNLFQIDF